MNGWIRLWIVVSLVWFVLVGAVTAFVIYEEAPFSPDGPWVRYRMQDHLSRFYENLKPGEKGPAYTIIITFNNGKSTEIRFTNLYDEIDSDLFRDKLTALAQSRDSILSEEEFGLFLRVLKENNNQAKVAKLEYDAIVGDLGAERQEERNSIMLHGALTSALPSLVVLILGYGIAWVRLGFKPKNSLFRGSAKICVKSSALVKYY